ncbi:MAG: hypothetical protein L7F77_14195, partial [Candidatus Magnetominusculus sp. LBB02]|nr:hypothetical protein [Candidatus Magnetominusculus sp. LBB02]
MGKDNYIQLPDGKMAGCRPKDHVELQAKNEGDGQKKDVVKKSAKPKTVIHGEEFAIPNSFHGDLPKRCIKMFGLSTELLADNGRVFPKGDLIRYLGDGYWYGQGSGYPANDNDTTASGERYGKDPDAVTINRIFSYKTYPTVRTNFVVVGDLGKDDGKIEIRRVNNTVLVQRELDKSDSQLRYY